MCGLCALGFVVILSLNACALDALYFSFVICCHGVQFLCNSFMRVKCSPFDVVLLPWAMCASAMFLLARGVPACMRV